MRHAIINSTSDAAIIAAAFTEDRNRILASISSAVFEKITEPLVMRIERGRMN